MNQLGTMSDLIFQRLGLFTKETIFMLMLIHHILTLAHFINRKKYKTYNY